MNAEIILQYITYLIIYSFAGWVLESICKTIEQRKFVNSGFLYGPICPIYGFGAIIMIICLSFLKDNILILFIAAFFVLSIWEYLVGVLLEKMFKTKYWDYSHLKFNIKGRVCLKNSIFWGILGVVFIYYIHTFVSKYILMIPFHILLYCNIILVVAIIVDLIVSIKSIVNLEKAIEKVNELGENIKEKLEEIKQINSRAKQKIVETEQNSIENIERMINELNLAQAKLKLKVYKKANQLKKAFPSIKSETVTNLLNHKIDMKKLKESIKIKNKK